MKPKRGRRSGSVRLFTLFLALAGIVFLTAYLIPTWFSSRATQDLRERLDGGFDPFPLMPPESVWPQIRRGADVNARGPRTGFTTLMYAANHRDDRLADFVIARGLDPNTCDQYGMTALSHAAKVGDADTIRYLVQHGAKLDGSGDPGANPLFWAAINTHPKAVRALLELGADPAPKSSAKNPILNSIIDDLHHTEHLVKAYPVPGQAQIIEDQKTIIRLLRAAIASRKAK